MLPTELSSFFDSNSELYLFDTDGSGGISLAEPLQAASKGLGNPTSAEDLEDIEDVEDLDFPPDFSSRPRPSTVTNLQVEPDAPGSISPPQFLKVL